MGVNTSTNMALPIPQVGNEAGPRYASDVNSCLTLVDQHNHAPGYGVAINPSGLDINADLSYNNNNLTLVRSVRMQSQTLPLSGVSDLGCLYEAGVDLYFNDGSGNQVRITQSGGIAGSPGSIANLTPPASAAYVAGSLTFVWQSGASTAANMDAGSLVLRNLTPGSSGLTLNPPNAMVFDYDITLPTLPSVSKILTIDSSGNMASVLDVDGMSLQITGGNTISVKPQGIQQDMLAPRATGTTVPAGGVGKAQAPDGSHSNFGPATIASVTITTTGRPVMVCCQAFDNSTDSKITIDPSPGDTFNILFLNGATTIANYSQTYNFSAVAVPTIPSSYSVIDFPTAGTYTYNLQLAVAVSSTVGIKNVALVVYEL